MAKLSRRARHYSQTSRNSNISMAIFKGVTVSIGVSLFGALFLSLISLLFDSQFIDNYIEYIMVAVTMTSIFAGSIYATKQIASKGFFVGWAVGIIYVLFSVGIGLELGQAEVSWLILGNKLVAASLAGILGGFIGVNL